MSDPYQKLSFIEKAGYSAGDAAANFVFMTMVLFQLNFYTDVFGLIGQRRRGHPALAATVGRRRSIPIMGVHRRSHQHALGQVPSLGALDLHPVGGRAWCSPTRRPKGWSMGMLIAYAGITNTVLMTLYSMNNMPYSALGGVMTADLNERTKLNSYRFVSVNIAQFIVGGFTLPLVAKFAVGHDRQYGWQMTMTLWAVLCVVLFVITFLTTRERVQPVVATTEYSPKQDFADLLKNGPWIALFVIHALQFRDADVSRRRPLQFLPPLRRQGGDVRLPRTGSDSPRPMPPDKAAFSSGWATSGTEHARTCLATSPTCSTASSTWRASPRPSS